MRVVPGGLRARSAVGFALLALLLSTLLSVATYQLARWYLLDQRQGLAERQALLETLCPVERVAKTIAIVGRLLCELSPCDEHIHYRAARSTGSTSSRAVCTGRSIARSHRPGSRGRTSASGRV